MPNYTHKGSTDSQSQAYDNLFKRLIEGQFAEIVPLLFSTLRPVVQRELTIEALLPPRRMDRVYLARTQAGKVILHIEIEMSPRGRDQTSRRILVYHALLAEKYNQENGEKIAVITLVIYPFEMPGGKPMLVETYGDDEFLRFCYQELSLRTIHAPTFVKTLPIPLYGWLPAMGDVNLEVLMNAIDDMVHYYKGDDDKLRDEFLCFLTLLNRARPLPEAEMEQVLRRLRMYDPLLEEDPWVQEYGGRQRAEGIAEGRAVGKVEGRAEGKAEGIVEGRTKGKAEGKAEGRAEGKVEGKTEGIRQSVEMLVQTRFPDFPDLLELAMERAGHIQDPTILQQLLVAMGTAQDENRARRYLLALSVNQ